MPGVRATDLRHLYPSSEFYLFRCCRIDPEAAPGAARDVELPMNGAVFALLDDSIGYNLHGTLRQAAKLAKYPRKL
jgi:hypothetical protein